MASKSKKSGKKPSPAQLAARKNFAKMAKERAAEARKGGGKKSNIGKSKRPAAIKTDEMPRKNFQVKAIKFKKRKPLSPRASRQYVGGPPSMQDDISKVSMRGPRLQLEALDESKFEIDLNGSFSKMGF